MTINVRRDGTEKKDERQYFEAFKERLLKQRGALFMC